MTTLAFQATPAAILPVSSRPFLSLHATLADAGIPTIPKADVRKYQRNMAIGEWNSGFVSALVTVLDRVLWIPRGYFIPRAIEWATGRQYGVAHFLLTVALFAAAFVGPWAGNSWSWWLTVPLLAAIPSTMALFFSYYALENRMRFMGSWRHTYLGDSSDRVIGMDSNFEEVPQPPDRLADRIERIKRLPGVRLLIRYRGVDPFLVAVNVWMPWQRADVGAWDTGNRTFDGL